MMGGAPFFLPHGIRPNVMLVLFETPSTRRPARNSAAQMLKSIDHTLNAATADSGTDDCAKKDKGRYAIQAGKPELVSSGWGRLEA
jgi:hypothetical protein